MRFCRRTTRNLAKLLGSWWWKRSRSLSTGASYTQIFRKHLFLSRQDWWIHYLDSSRVKFRHRLKFKITSCCVFCVWDKRKDYSRAYLRLLPSSSLPVPTSTYCYCSFRSRVLVFPIWGRPHGVRRLWCLIKLWFNVQGVWFIIIEMPSGTLPQSVYVITPKVVCRLPALLFVSCEYSHPRLQSILSLWTRNSLVLLLSSSTSTCISVVFITSPIWKATVPCSPTCGYVDNPNRDTLLTCVCTPPLVLLCPSAIPDICCEPVLPLKPALVKSTSLVRMLNSSLSLMA